MSEVEDQLDESGNTQGNVGWDGRELMNTIKNKIKLWLTATFRFTIGTKLVGLVAGLLMSSVITLVWLSTQMFVESDTALIQQTNADTAANLATQMRESFQSTTEKMRILGAILLKTSHTLPNRPQLIAEFFAKDPDFLAVYLENVDSNGKFATIARGLSPAMATLHDETGDETLTAAKEEKDFSLNSVIEGEVQISSMSLLDGDPAIALGVPFMQDSSSNRFTHILIAILRQGKFVKAFSESELVTSYMVDRQGKVLAHPDPEIVNLRMNFAHIPIVKELLSGKFNNGQTRYKDPKTKIEKLGAFRIVGFGGLGVIAEVAEAKAFEAAKKVVYRSALVAWIILCLSFLAGYLYSGTITWPIRKLVDAAKEISAGNFKINLSAQGRDEIARLSSAFNEMAKGLEERDRVKETFNKFHNKEIAEKLLSGEVKLGGERKIAVVFFSDVRGFTAMSEMMQPEQVVEMLNEYMTRMVAIIRSYRGVVDKYVGDAIMAIWGVPINTEDDCYNAVRACLAMREDLEKLNELRMSRGQPVIKIGMGLNAGPLIAGNIGSNEKMEYTVIGDAVNLASRIESMTKEHGTDLLVSRSIYERVANRFVFEAGTRTHVKGKSEAVQVFKVRGYLDESGAPIVIETPYSSYAPEKSDKVVHYIERGSEEDLALREIEAKKEEHPLEPGIPIPMAGLVSAAEPEPGTKTKIIRARPRGNQIVPPPMTHLPPPFRARSSGPRTPVPPPMTHMPPPFRAHSSGPRTPVPPPMTHMPPPFRGRA